MTTVVKGQRQRQDPFHRTNKRSCRQAAGGYSPTYETQQPELIGMHETSASGHSAPLIHPWPFALARSRPSNPQDTRRIVYRPVSPCSPPPPRHDPRVLCHLAGNFASYLPGSLLSPLTATPGERWSVYGRHLRLAAQSRLCSNAATELEFRLRRKGVRRLGKAIVAPLMASNINIAARMIQCSW